MRPISRRSNSASGPSGCAGGGEDLPLGLDHLELAGVRPGGFELAVEGDGLAGVEAALEVLAAEPHGLDGVDALANGDLEDLPAAAFE